MKVRWIDAGKVSDFRSQSIYHGLGYAYKTGSPNTVVLSIPEKPYMCVGYFQDPKKELDLSYCKENNIPVIRRQTGGGAVYIDNRQLFVQWVFNPSSIPQKVDRKFQLFIEPMVETYKFFGINAYEYGGHDVHVNGKKIVGTGAARIGEAEVVTGNFIKGFDNNPMVDALNLPNKIMRAEVQRGVDNYMSSLSAELNTVPDFDEVKMVYKRKCKDILGMDIFEGDFTGEELSEIEKQEAKLSSEEWTFSITQPEKSCRVIKIHTGVWVGSTNYNAGNLMVNITIRINENSIDFAKIDVDEIQNEEVIGLLELAVTKMIFSKDNIISVLDVFFKTHGSKWSPLKTEQWVEALMTIYNEKKKISGGG